MPDAPPLQLSWSQWAAILVPLWLLLALWMRWCLQRTRPTPPPRPRQKEIPE